MIRPARIFTDEELQSVGVLKVFGNDAVYIGKSLHQPGESDSNDAHRHRGNKAINEAIKKGFLVLENSAPISNKTEEKPQAPSIAESITITGNTMELSLPKTRIKTLDQLIVECEVDTRLWQVDRFVCNKWEMGYLTREKEPGVQDLYQVKATFKAKVQEYNAHNALEKTIDTLRTYAPTYPSRPLITPKSGGVLLEMSLPDVHIGKLAWGQETGEDYSLTIAAERYMDAFLYLLGDATKRCTLDKIIFPIGNDLLNCDGPHGNTTSGTPQSNDGRYQRAYQTTLGLIVGAVERMMEVAPVEVLSVPGNHDTLSAWTLTETLSAWFHKTDRVKVDNSPTLRKYHRWGKCLLGWTHGDKEKYDRLPLIMAQERAEEWSQTKHREWHLGHLHTTRSKVYGEVDEFVGVRVRLLPSLCATDAWHYGQGYVGNIKSAEAYLWHQERGMIGTSVYNV